MSKRKRAGTPTISEIGKSQPDATDWRSERFRQACANRIEEAVKCSGTPVSKSSVEVEMHVFAKAKSREEYLALVARLILYFEERGKNQQFKSDLFKTDFFKLFSNDSIPSYDGRILVVGAYEAGKTTLVMNLIDEEIPRERQSTDGIDVYFGKLLFDIISNKLLKRRAGEHSFPKSVYQKVLAFTRHAKPPDIQTSFKYIENHATQNDAKESFPSKNDLLTKFSEIINSFGQTTEPGIQNLIPIPIVDFAGQYIYYATHQTFITSHGIYMVTFNGSLGLDSHLSDKSHTEGLITILDNIRHWVSSILAYCSRDNKGFPKIVFVATNKDLLKFETVEEKRSTMLKAITGCFTEERITQHLALEKIFFVNALDKQDPEMDELRLFLSKTIITNPLWGRMVPKQFLILEMMFASLMEEGKYILTRAEVEELNTHTDFEALTTDQLEGFLQLQNMHGKLTYFNSRQLKDYVVINPTCLIEILKSIVTAAPTTKELTQGRLKKSRLTDLWNSDQFAKFRPFQNFFRHLLIHFDVLSEAKRYDKNTGQKIDVDFYFVPCMITTRNTTTYSRIYLTSERCIGFLFAFRGSDVPTALPNRLIASILSIWNVKTYQGEDLLFAGFAVVVLDRKHDLVIQIEQNNIAVFLVHHKQKALITRDLASCVRECLEQNLTRISEVYSISFTDEVKQHRYFPFDLMIKPSCLSTECRLSPEDIFQQEPTHVCQAHGHKTSISELTIWYTDRTLKECPQNCQGILEPIISSLPNDTQLLRLCDCLLSDDITKLALELGATYSKLDAIRRDHSLTTMANFYSLRLCREKNKRCGDFVKCMEKAGINVHNMCKILRQQEIQSNIPDNILICRPSDEMLDKLCIRIGMEWMILGLELGFEIETLEQLKDYHRGMKETTRSMLDLWKSREESGTIRELVEALGRAGRNPDLLRDILENCSSFPSLNALD